MSEEVAAPAVTPLPLRKTIADVVALCRAHWRLLVPLAFVALIPQAIGDALVGSYEVHSIHNFGDAARMLTFPLTIAINLGGEALYSGVIAAIALHWRAGVERPELRRIAPHIPYKRLIAADLMIAVGTAVGLVLLVIPGIMFATYTFVWPALIELRALTVRAALRESLTLVKGNFWRVLIIGLLFYEGTEIVANLAVAPFHAAEVEAAVHLAVEAVVEPLQGVSAVIVALALIESHGLKTRELN